MLAVAALISPVPAAAAPVNPHPSLVPENVQRGYPIILGTPTYPGGNGQTRNREVLASHQSGDYIVAGGNFLQVERQDGTVVSQPYLTASSITTKAMVCAGQLAPDNEVLAVEPGATPGTAYIGGMFNRVTGADGVSRARSKIALVDLSNCSVNTTFAPVGTNSRVSDIFLVAGRLFVGGDFTSIGNQSIAYLAELDAATGAVRTSFRLTFGPSSLSSKIRAVGGTQDGRRLIVAGRFARVSDGVRTLDTQTAVVDISNPAQPRLTAHSFVQTHPESGTRPLGQSMQDASISPDGSTIALVYGTATISDYVYLVDAADRAQPIRWRHYMEDTSTGVAVNNQAVYVAGHFCRIDPGPGVTSMMAPRMGLDDCDGAAGSDNVWRSHVAALSLTDGTPLTWNPGATGFFGGRDLTVTSRGLLLGFDGDRANNYIRTGALAFFDFG